MVPPSVVIENGMGRRRLARSFSWGVAAERLGNAIFVVINSELFQLSLQVGCVPGEYVIIRADGTRVRVGSTSSLRPGVCASWRANDGNEIVGRGRNSGAEETPPVGDLGLSARPRQVARMHCRHH